MTHDAFDTMVSAVSGYTSYKECAHLPGNHHTDRVRALLAPLVGDVLRELTGYFHENARRYDMDAYHASGPSPRGCVDRGEAVWSAAAHEVHAFITNGCHLEGYGTEVDSDGVTG